MQFRIRDVLTITFIVAFAMFAFRRQRLVGETRAELQQTNNLNAILQSEIAGAENALRDEDMRKAYCHQIEKLGRSVKKQYEDVRLKDPTLPPKHGMVWLQSIPAFDLEPGLQVWRGRVHVPPQEPAFLYCDITYAEFGGLNPVDEDWSLHTGFSGTIPWSTKLSPGDHLVEIQTIRTADLAKWQVRFGLDQRAKFGLLLGLRILIDDRQVFQSAYVMENAKRVPIEVHDPISAFEYPQYFEPPLNLSETEWSTFVSNNWQQRARVQVSLLGNVTDIEVAE